jgi:hypothetical protein
LEKDFLKEMPKTSFLSGQQEKTTRENRAYRRTQAHSGFDCQAIQFWF